MRCLSLPSLPTAWVTREVSRARVSLSERDVVEGIGDLAVHAGERRRQAHGEVALLERQHGREQGVGELVGLPGAVRIGPRGAEDLRDGAA